MLNFFDIDNIYHLILAFIACGGFYWWTKHLQKAFLYTVGLAFVWEIAEYFYNVDSYHSLKHFLADAITDIAMALLASFIFVVGLKIYKGFKK